MKKLFYFFCVASALMCCSSLYGQNGTDSNNALPAFSTIAPSVQLLKTGYPSIKAGNTVPIKYSKDTVQGIHKFIGRKITTDFIRDKIGLYMVKDTTQWKDTYTKVVAFIQQNVL